MTKLTLNLLKVSAIFLYDG